MLPFLYSCLNQGAKTITAITLLTGIICCNAVAQDQDSPVLTIGTISGQIAETTAPDLFEDYLESKLGTYQFQVREFADIEALMRALINASISANSLT